VQSERAALPVLPIQYADFAAWQRGREKVFEKRLPFWRQRLAGQPTRLHLAGASAGGHSGSAWQSPQGATVSRRSTGGLGEAARLLSRRLGTTQFVMLEAAFKVLLHRHCGDADISVGTPAANRGYRALDHLVGCFISMLVLRSDLSGNPSFEELVKRERERCYTAYVHQEVPFQMLVRDIAPRRELGVHPLFQVLFSLRTLGGIDLSGSGVHGERVHLHNGTAKYDLSVEATVRDDGEIDLWAEYRVERFEAATVAGWLEEYEALLRAVATDPGRSIADLK
jgi:non-ribosomal peptide synthetase component F